MDGGVLRSLSDKTYDKRKGVPHLPWSLPYHLTRVFKCCLNRLQWPH